MVTMKRFLQFVCTALVLGLLFASCSTEAEHDLGPWPGQSFERNPAPMGWEDRRDQWDLVWRDEFLGDQLDRTRWNIDTGTGAQFGLIGWGNHELQYYSESNVMIWNGMLVIQASNVGRGGRAFTSGKVTTGGTRSSPGYGNRIYPERFSISEGFIEARMRSPRGTGLWPAFWTLGTNSNPYGSGGSAAHVGWPSSGEIDIMEIRGHQLDRFLATIHHGTDYGTGQRWFPGATMRTDIGAFNPLGTQATQGVPEGESRVILRTPVRLPEGMDLANEFHVYGVRWDANSIDFYFNGVNWVSIDLTRLYGGGNANAAAFTYQLGQFININVAMGGNFLPTAYRQPDSVLFAEDAPWEDRSLMVDWVRVYRRVGGNSVVRINGEVIQ